MPAKLIPKQDIPKQHTTPGGLVVREFTREEIAQRRKDRAAGKLRDEPPADLLPADTRRKRKRRNVTITDEAARIARKLGNDNVSAGIERALVHYAECALVHGPRGRKRKLT